MRTLPVLPGGFYWHAASCGYVSPTHVTLSIRRYRWWGADVILNQGNYCIATDAELCGDSIPQYHNLCCETVFEVADRLFITAYSHRLSLQESEQWAQAVADHQRNRIMSDIKPGRIK